ncbi:hypothetical protein NMY22_g18953 [Coprinellus aureogranulatus]|nr:hypothetical protein NMY22_g18953 [Coprinellus aureogranulatus]
MGRDIAFSPTTYSSHFLMSLLLGRNESTGHNDQRANSTRDALQQESDPFLVKHENGAVNAAPKGVPIWTVFLQVRGNGKAAAIKGESNSLVDEFGLGQSVSAATYGRRSGSFKHFSEPGMLHPADVSINAPPSPIEPLQGAQRERPARAPTTTPPTPVRVAWRTEVVVPMQLKAPVVAYGPVYARLYNELESVPGACRALATILEELEDAEKVRVRAAQALDEHRQTLLLVGHSSWPTHSIPSPPSTVSTVQTPPPIVPKPAPAVATSSQPIPPKAMPVTLAAQGPESQSKPRAPRPRPRPTPPGKKVVADPQDSRQQRAHNNERSGEPVVKAEPTIETLAALQHAATAPTSHILPSGEVSIVADSLCDTYVRLDVVNSETVNIGQQEMIVDTQDGEQGMALATIKDEVMLDNLAQSIQEAEKAKQALTASKPVKQGSSNGKAVKQGSSNGKAVKQGSSNGKAGKRKREVKTGDQAEASNAVVPKAKSGKKRKVTVKGVGEGTGDAVQPESQEVTVHDSGPVENDDDDRNVLTVWILVKQYKVLNGSGEPQLVSIRVMAPNDEDDAERKKIYELGDIALHNLAAAGINIPRHLLVRLR